MIAASGATRELLDHLLEGCQVIGPDFRYLFVNDAVALQGRQPKHALVGRPMTEVYPGIEHTAMFAVLRRCLEQRTPQQMENEFTFPDGSRGWFELRFQPVPEGVFILSMDITARKRAEDALARSSRALATLSECNQALVRAVDEATFVADVCRIAVELGGYGLAWIGARMDDPEQSIRPVASAGASGSGLASGAWADSPRAGPAGRAIRGKAAVIERFLAAGSPIAPWREDALRARFGACASFPLVVEREVFGAFTLYAGAPDAFDDREVRLLEELACDLAFGIEAQRRRRAHERAEERVLHLNAVLRGVRSVNQLITRERDPSTLIQRTCDLLIESRGFHSCFVLLAERGRVTQVAGAGDEQHVSRVREQVLGHGCLPACARKALSEAVLVRHRDIAASGTGCPLAEGCAANRDAVAVPLVSETTTYGVLVAALPAHAAADEEERGLLREAAGDVAFALRSIGTEEQLRQSQKLEAVGRLAGGIAHDFNNLLAVILSYTGFAIEGVREGDPLRDDLEEVRKAGSRAAALTRQLLAFSRKQVMKPEVISLNDVLRGMEGMLRRLIGEDVALTILLAPDLGKVKADPGQVEQVVLNLAVNARDAMPDGGTLAIETANVLVDAEQAARDSGASPGPHVSLGVSDTGSGMDAATRARIFEPFFTTKPVGKGTGLGLSTVYGIVKQSGGSVTVASEPGEGSTFRICFPRLPADAQAAAAPPRAVTSAKGTETILVVEDDEPVRNLAKRILEAAGYTVLAAANGGEALLTLERHPGTVHLLLTDVIMPQMSGRELAERLAKVRPGVKVLYSSGYTDNAIAHHGVLDPGTSFIAKPFGAAELTRRVREVLDAPPRP